MTHNEVQAIRTQKLTQIEFEAYINSQADEIAPEIEINSVMDDFGLLNPCLVWFSVAWHIGDCTSTRSNHNK